MPSSNGCGQPKGWLIDLEFYRKQVNGLSTIESLLGALEDSRQEVLTKVSGSLEKGQEATQSALQSGNMQMSETHKTFAEASQAALNKQTELVNSIKEKLQSPSSENPAIEKIKSLLEKQTTSLTSWSDKLPAAEPFVLLPLLLDQYNKQKSLRYKLGKGIINH